MIGKWYLYYKHVKKEINYMVSQAGKENYEEYSLSLPLIFGAVGLNKVF